MVEKRFQELVFSRESRSQHASRALETSPQGNAYQYVVDLPASGKASVNVPELDTCFFLKVVDWPIAQSETKRGSVALDADLLYPPLILRNWRPGDAYRPTGRRKARKLEEMFLARHIPNGKRGLWPVLESAGQVVWTRGMSPADEFSAREGTRAGLVIEEDRL